MRVMVKKVKLHASMDYFKFTDGKKCFNFDTKLYLNSGGLITGVGVKPDDHESYTEYRLFQSPDRSLDFLTATLLYGSQHFCGRFRILPSHLDVLVSHDLVQVLQGLEIPIFERAGKDAGISKVLVSQCGPS